MAGHLYEVWLVLTDLVEPALLEVKTSQNVVGTKSASCPDIVI